LRCGYLCDCWFGRITKKGSAPGAQRRPQPKEGVRPPQKSKEEIRVQGKRKGAGTVL
jgi:hypothetical protein